MSSLVSDLAQNYLRVFVRMAQNYWDPPTKMHLPLANLTKFALLGALTFDLNELEVIFESYLIDLDFLQLEGETPRYKNSA